MAQNEKYVVHSMHKIEIAPPGADGAVGSEWSDLTDYFVADGSVNFEHEAPTQQAINYLKDTNNPLITVITDVPERKFKFGLRSLSPAIRVLLQGGEAGNNGEWKRPAKPKASSNWSLRVTSTASDDYGLHSVIVWPVAKLVAFDNGNMAPTDTLLLNVEATMQTPYNSIGLALSPEIVSLSPIAPENLVVSDNGNTLAFTAVVPFVLTDYEYSKNGGAAWTDVSSNPITGFTGNIAAADIIVRVKAVDDTFSSGIEASPSVGFTA